MRKQFLLVLLFVCLIQLVLSEECEEEEKKEKATRYQIAQFEWEEVKVPMTIAVRHRQSHT
jgi:Na+-transporting methylmalonyl-CoA/oxaloacetate decarboxylase gamma subunit